MTELEQIEEMATVLAQTVLEKHNNLSLLDFAKALYAAGYRKQVESEWETTILVKTSTMIRTGAPHCKNCGRTTPHRTQFCPHCGARMKDGE